MEILDLIIDMPFNSIPLLDVNNGEQVINQSLAIGRFLAKRFGKKGNRLKTCVDANHSNQSLVCKRSLMISRRCWKKCVWASSCWPIRRRMERYYKTIHDCRSTCYARKHGSRSLKKKIAHINDPVYFCIVHFQKEAYAQFKQETLDVYLRRYENFLNANPTHSGWLVGDSVRIYDWLTLWNIIFFYSFKGNMGWFSCRRISRQD